MGFSVRFWGVIGLVGMLCTPLAAQEWYGFPGPLPVNSWFKLKVNTPACPNPDCFETWTVVSVNEEWKNIPAIKIEIQTEGTDVDGDVYDETLNAYLRKDNAAMLAVVWDGFLSVTIDEALAGEDEAHTGDWNWPLYVGKQWTHEYRRYIKSHNGEEPYELETQWRVAAQESVRVPAGVCQNALRVEGKNKIEHTKRWYVPSIGFPVRMVVNRKIDYHGLKGTSVYELVDYYMPAKEEATC